MQGKGFTRSGQLLGCIRKIARLGPHSRHATEQSVYSFHEPRGDFGMFLPGTLNWGYLVPNSGYLGPNRR